MESLINSRALFVIVSYVTNDIVTRISTGVPLPAITLLPNAKSLRSESGTEASAAMGVRLIRGPVRPPPRPRDRRGRWKRGAVEQFKEFVRIRTVVRTNLHAALMTKHLQHKI